MTDVRARPESPGAASPDAKYADVMVDWLRELGYTHCFYLAGGNTMHLLNAVRTRMTCVAFVHEVSAGIAAEYFNAGGGEGRAFVLVTAGPGLTQVVSALGGAFLESRELLVLGGQVKSTDLIGSSGVRQRGIQEIDGVAIASPVCVLAERIDKPIDRDTFTAYVRAGQAGRPGPVFLEVCLDVQAAPVQRAALEEPGSVAWYGAMPKLTIDDERRLADELRAAQRPVLLLGGGLTRQAVDAALPGLRELGVPLMTTWNAIDRVGVEEPLYMGRPNTWGQRSANILLQQADLVIALGTRLGLQQTGFNWQQFVPVGRLIQVEIDHAELHKGHPDVDWRLQADANEVLAAIARSDVRGDPEWVAFCRRVRDLIPVDEPDVNTTGEGYLPPLTFALTLAGLCTADDVIVPCSSGGANSTTMQAWAQKQGQVVLSDKGLASMGYGLAGAIGAALAHGRRTVLIEGDGGFSQNLQELATVAVNNLPLKIFIHANDGYASIRTTQRNYFNGAYIGCDIPSGLGFPDWPQLFGAFGIPTHALDTSFPDDARFRELFDAPGPAAFLVPIDPEQTYFPKIASRVTETGGMESNPLHHMSPPLPDEIARVVFVHVPAGPDA